MQQLEGTGPFYSIRLTRRGEINSVQVNKLVDKEDKVEREHTYELISLFKVGNFL